MAIISIGPEQLELLIAQKLDLQLIDVRTTEEYFFLGHIPKAQLLPLHELPQRLTELDKTKPVALVCQHGVRSLQAAEYFHIKGFTLIYNLSEGMAAWQGDCIHSA